MVTASEQMLVYLDELYQKYKFMERNLVAKKERLQTRLPELKTNLEIIDKLEAQKKSSTPTDTTFLLSEQVSILSYNG